jgi:hypothetical protein
MCLEKLLTFQCLAALEFFAFSWNYYIYAAQDFTVIMLIRAFLNGDVRSTEFDVIFM